MDYEAELKNGNLNSLNGQNLASWDKMAENSADHNLASLGKQAIFSEAPADAPLSPEAMAILSPESAMPPLGEIVETTPRVEPQPTSLDTTAFAPSGDHLSPRTVAAVDNLINETRDSSKTLCNIYNDISVARSAFLAKSGFTGGAK